MQYLDRSRLFKVIRSEDKKGISGTGKVIEGVVFPDGKTVIQWQGKYPSISVFTNLREFQEVHCKPIFAENEFLWQEGYEPAEEVYDVCDQIVQFILNYSGGRINDRTKGDLISKVTAIKRSHIKRGNGGLSPGYLRNVERNKRVK